MIENSRHKQHSIHNKGIKQHISELKMVLVTHTKAFAMGFDTADEFVETSTT